MTCDEARALTEGQLVWMVHDDLGRLSVGEVVWVGPREFSVRWEDRQLGTFGVDDDWRLARLSLDGRTCDWDRGAHRWPVFVEEYGRR
jgi:hypothetical protein